MKLNLDSHRISLTCPQCAKKFEETIGRLKNNPKVVCAGCGTTIQIEADELRRSVASVQKQMDALGKALGNLGK